jgi:hypothetical protein
MYVLCVSLFATDVLYAILGGHFRWPFLGGHFITLQVEDALFSHSAFGLAFICAI